MLSIHNFSKLFVFFCVASCVSISASVAQVYAPASDWTSATDYYFAAEQDPVFVFFNRNDIEIRAQFSDSTAASYTWYKYNSNVFPYIDRFQVIEGEKDSVLTGITRGGYLVEVKNIQIDSVETYICWVFTDNVEVEDFIVLSNTCEALELMLSTSPNFFFLSSFFTYYDISRETHQEMNLLGSVGYFDNHNFISSSDSVDVPQTIYTLPFVNIEFVNERNGITHGPLHDSNYELTINPPFGKQPIVVETPIVSAVATKADFEIRFWDNENESFGAAETDEIPKGEALLEMELKSMSKNADSVYWNILNDKLRFAKGKDSLIWQDSSLFVERTKSYPDKKRLIPGFYSVEHISVKNSPGLTCLDTVFTMVEVDTSFVQNIPNVFTPGGGLYPVFTIQPEDLQSLKSFKIVIYSRSGKPVYRYTGNPKQWEGWNGQLDNTKGDVPSGVYYYVIDAVGWDGVRYRRWNNKGFVHLYR